MVLAALASASSKLPRAPMALILGVARTRAACGLGSVGVGLLSELATFADEGDGQGRCVSEGEGGCVRGMDDVFIELPGNVCRITVPGAKAVGSPTTKLVHGFLALVDAIAFICCLASCILLLVLR